MAKRWSVDVAVRARDKGYKIPPDGRAVISSRGGRTKSPKSRLRLRDDVRDFQHKFSLNTELEAISMQCGGVIVGYPLCR